jgi:hypothetical protein
MPTLPDQPGQCPDNAWKGLEKAQLLMIFPA